MNYRYSQVLPAFAFSYDLLLLNLVLYNPIYLSLNAAGGHDNAIQLVMLANAIWIVSSYPLKVYQLSKPLLLNDNLKRFILSALFHLAIMAGYLRWYNYQLDLFSKLALTYLFFLVGGGVARLFLSHMLSLVKKEELNGRNILVLGDEHIAKCLIKQFSIHPEYSYDLIDRRFGSVDAYSASEIVAQARERKPDEIFLCCKRISREVHEHLSNFGISHSIKIKHVPELILSNDFAKGISVEKLPTLSPIPNKHYVKPTIRLAKRCFDIAFSSVTMIAGAPLYVAVYAITKATSKGPAFYYQERIGENGKPFHIVKFRSMMVDAEKNGPQPACHNDPRVTKWGRIIRKTKIDELPQFWNVFKGDMSIVGPRPERQYFIERITEKTPEYKNLLNIKPGITSIGQVHYGYAENVDQMCERMHYDLLYLQNMSLTQDLRLIAKTVKIMIEGKGK